ncbi:MAG: 2-oxo acid dehydrogenase subunit E2 [Alphaproteobacteria bacterium]|nr:2-oxo acid dehydrogenase subunit E2 [Alphaproteobacteria bacterium]MBV9695169.1 2-oxo acid dehydrogenase subunit E2 [Alphaproteobacteria bacterium]
MTTDIRAPMEQEGTKSVLKTWLKNVGDAVRADEPLLELETDKVAVEIAAPCDGVLAEIAVQPDDDVEPGMLLGRIAQQRAGSADKAVTQRAAPATPPAPRAETAVAAPLSPGIRKLLAEHGLSASEVPVSGARLTREDIEAEVKRRGAGGDGGVVKVPHDSMRRRIAEHMTRSVTVAPHVTAVFEADFSAPLAHRALQKSKGVSLTYSAYLVWAAARAMEAAPAVNGRWFEDRIEIYDDVNIGVGTALGDKGLVVPVIARAQTLSLLEIAGRLQDLTARARDGTLKPEDVRGGTFSISNHGTSGSLLAAPIIINQPQAAILGIGKLENRAVVRDDRVAIRPMAYVTLTIDHRMLDGHQTNAWLTKFVALLEGWPLEA